MRKAIIVVFLIVLLAFFIRARDNRVNSVQYTFYEENGSARYVFSFLSGEGVKNHVVFPFDPGIDAKGLLLEVEEIDAITSLDDSAGYVRAFGGIGKNFPLVANKSYEVSVVKSINYTVYRK